MKPVKHSLANNIILHLISLLLVAYIILFCGAQHFISRMIQTESDHYGNAIAGIYGDLVCYEAEGVHLPVDENFSETADFYAEYMCSWYRVDCLYMYIPDLENNTIKILSAAKKGGLPSNIYSGKTMDYTLSEEELAVWNEEKPFINVKNNLIEEARDSIMVMSDTFGNKFIVGSSVSAEALNKEMINELVIIALGMLLIFGALIVGTYLILYRKLAVPTRELCSKMVDFTKDDTINKTRLDENKKGEYGLIARSFNIMADNIDSYMTDINTLSREQERQQTEMDVASNIQQGFLPPLQTSFKNCDICAMMSPAKNVGGDLYDYMQLDDSHYLAVIADVSGKGISAAMLMSITLMLIRQYAKLGLSPKDILKHTNNMISERNPKMMFVTAFVAIYDSNKRALTYANAGHNLPYIVGEQTTVLSGAQNPLLGLFPDESFTEKTIKMAIGDILFLYTDGVNEAVSKNNTFYGTQRLEETLSVQRILHNNDIVNAVKESVQEFTGKQEQHDDITMLALTIKEHQEVDVPVNEDDFSKIRNIIMQCRLNRALKMKLCLAAEEIFINICSYAYREKSKENESVHFTLDVSNRFVLQFIDSGMPYDPRESVQDPDEYDIDTQIGGLGKLIAFSVADTVDYEYKDGKNILTLTKFIVKEDTQNDNY